MAVDTEQIVDLDQDFTERQEVYRYIRGAIKNCINAHGPITTLLIDSCTKRIVGELLSTGFLRNWGRLRKSYVDEKCDNCGNVIPAGKLYRRTQTFKCCFVCLPQEGKDESQRIHSATSGPCL